MLKFIRHSTQTLRALLIAAAAVLLLASVLEAGHGHGVFVPADDTCAICQQAIGIDKTLISQPASALLLLVTVLALGLSILASPRITTPFTHIRAPPIQRHSR
jgi:hypothetical protein